MLKRKSLLHKVKSKKKIKAHNGIDIVYDFALGNSTCPNHPYLLGVWIASSGVGMCYECAVSNAPVSNLGKGVPFLFTKNEEVATVKESDYILFTHPTVAKVIDTGNEYYEWGRKMSPVVAYAESKFEGGVNLVVPRVEPIIEKAKPLLVRADRLLYGVLDSRVTSFALTSANKLFGSFLPFTVKNKLITNH